MSVKTILLCLTQAARAPELIRAGALLARKHSAHLTGIHTMESLVVYPGVSMHLDAAAFEEFDRRQLAAAAELEDLFQSEVRKEVFPSEWRLLKTQTASAADRFIESARAADLVLMAQEDHSHDRYDQTRLQTRMIREAGRPVLMIPQGYEPDELGHSVLLGWSATREATRAAHDAVQLIDADGEVTILTVNPQTTDELADYPATELALMFDRHGLSSNVVHRQSDDYSIAEILIREAEECGADMIVTGAFGHSWAHDFVLGAVTRDLLRAAPLPVLFSK